MPVPLIAAGVAKAAAAKAAAAVAAKAVAAKAVAAKAVAAKAAAVTTKTAATKVAAKAATTTATKTASVKALPKIAPKQKIGLDLLGDSKANVYPGKVSPTGSKLKKIADKLKDKAQKAMEGISEQGDSKGTEWSKRGPIVTGSSNPAPDSSGYDEQINKLKNLQ